MVSEPRGGSIDFELEGAVAVVRLNNPPVNAITCSMTRQMNKLLGVLEEHTSVRAVILRGDGTRAFSAGSDINEMPGLAERKSVVDEKVAFENDTLDRLEALPLPTIAALNGVALGGGLEWALCCDLIIAEKHVRLGLPEVDLGLIPSGGGTMRAIERIGVARTNELVLTGSSISAKTASEWGLINHVAETGCSLPDAISLTERLIAKPMSALRLNKMAVAASRRRSVATVVDLFEAAFMTVESQERIGNFLATPKLSAPVQM